MAYIGSAPTTTASRKSQTTYRYLCTAGQTVFSGADLNNNTLSCDPLDTEVFMNGLKLDSTDTTITATQVTLAVAAAAGDELEVVAFRTFESADHYTKSAADARYEPIDSAYTKAEADTRYVNASGDTVTGALTVDTSTTTNLTVDSGNYGGIQFKAAGTDTGYITSFTNGSGAESMYIGGADAVYLHTGTNHALSNGTTRLQINASGHVTTPYQPSFWAYMSQSNPNVTTSNIKIPYSATRWNVGSHFDTTNSRFVAPIAGKYCFQVNHNVYGLSDDQWFRTRVYVNGSSYQILGYMRARGSGDHTTNDSFLLDMSANDYVEIYSNSPDTSYYLSAAIGWNSFSGFLIG